MDEDKKQALLAAEKEHVTHCVKLARQTCNCINCQGLYAGPGGVPISCVAPAIVHALLMPEGGNG